MTREELLRRAREQALARRRGADILCPCSDLPSPHDLRDPAHDDALAERMLGWLDDDTTSEDW